MRKTTRRLEALQAIAEQELTPELCARAAAFQLVGHLGNGIDVSSDEEVNKKFLSAGHELDSVKTGINGLLLAHIGCGSCQQTIVLYGPPERQTLTQTDPLLCPALFAIDASSRLN